MDRLTRSIVRVVALGATCAMLLGASGTAKADSISLQLNSTLITTTSGGTAVFNGTVTNNSGTDLNASGFFLNFFGFDPINVNPVQDLGVSGDFPIPNGTTSGVTDIFSILLGPVPNGSTFPIGVLLEDINGDLSATQTVTVSVPGSVAQTPEPSSLFLLLSGLCGLLAAKRRHDVSTN